MAKQKERGAWRAGIPACVAVKPSSSWGYWPAVFAVVLIFGSTAAASWRQEISGTTERETDLSRAVATDSSGNVFAGGVLQTISGPVFTVVKYAAADGTELWREDLSGTAGIEQGVHAIAVDSAGNALAAGEIDLDLTVVKFDGASGAELWRASLDGGNLGFQTPEEARTVVVDGSDNVYVAGFLNTTAGGRDFAVAKLDGGTGAELWRQEIDGGNGGADRALGLVLDPTGDVVAGGRLTSAVAFDDFTVIKFSGATGTELWRTRIDGDDNSDDEVAAVAIDLNGDVLAAGIIDSVATQEDYAVVKLSGATGAELWRQAVEGGGTGDPTMEKATDVAVDSTGDVAAIGDLDYLGREQDLVVIKFDGTSGAEQWRQEIDGEMLASRDGGFEIEFDQNDDVIAGGRIENGPRPDFDFSIFKFAGATGEEVWRQRLDGTKTTGPGVEEVHSMVVDPAGDIVASGFIENKPTDRDFTVVKIDGESGIIGPVRGSKFFLRDFAGEPTRRRLKAELREFSLLIPPLGSANDPSLVGAEVRIVNPTTLEEALFFIPPGSDWRISTSPSGAAIGYTYKASKGVVNACNFVRARLGEEIKVVCSGKRGPFDFTLDEASQGSMSFTVSFGTLPPQCATFGGRVSRDFGTSNPGPKGQFKGAAAPAALGSPCP